MIMFMHRTDTGALLGAMKAKGLNAPALARLIPTNERYFRFILAGACPGPSVRARIALALEIEELALFPVAAAHPDNALVTR